jgi:hypothetical protein
MGCDCHFFVERKTSSNNYEGPRNLSEDRNTKIEQIIEGMPITERWVSADKWENDGFHWVVSYEDIFYRSRNYYLFSILADVRNDGSVDPLCEPRGIPDDCSYGYKYMCNLWNIDAHSHSYFTLQELLEVDWSIYNQNYLKQFFETIERLKQIDNDYSKIRVVFFFDN